MLITHANVLDHVTPIPTGHSAIVAHTLVYVSRAYLVISADQEQLLRVLDLERQQQADRLQAVRAAIHIVSQEQIVAVIDISVGRWGNVAFKDAHEVGKLAMDVAEDLDRCCSSKKECRRDFLNLSRTGCVKMSSYVKCGTERTAAEIITC